MSKFVAQHFGPFVKTLDHSQIAQQLPTYAKQLTDFVSPECDMQAH